MAVQRISGLTLVPVVLALAAIAWSVDDRRAAWMVRRTRVLFAAILLLYAWSNGTTALVPALGAWSPTAEGLLGGAEQIARLMAAISLSVAFFGRAHGADLVSGLHDLSRPFVRFGFPADRFAVRTALTLYYAESFQLGSPRRWLEALRAAPDADAARAVRFVQMRLRVRDWCCLGVAAALTTIAVWR